MTDHMPALADALVRWARPGTLDDVPDYVARKCPILDDQQRERLVALVIDRLPEDKRPPSSCA